jgi:hypothetical protein
MISRTARQAEVCPGHASVPLDVEVEMDTCHFMMISEPERLAGIIIERCRLYA